MARDYLTCPFCGFEFARQDALCEHGCPLATFCGLARCPNCQYEFADRPRGVAWWRRLLGRRAARSNEETCPVTSVRELRSGDRATVVAVSDRRPSRQNALAVFGLVPGTEITLLQSRPACVIAVGETQLAVDAPIAEEILVEVVRG